MSYLIPKLPPLSTLVVFEAAVRLGSFSRAADECALSQASVSRQMRQLEDDLELRLFERQRYDVSTTDAGNKLYKTVRQALGELASTSVELRETARGQSSFTIYSDLSIGSSVLAPLVGRFQELYPHIKFNILSSYEPIEQTQSSFDIGFQVGRRAEDIFDIETLADDLVFPVCSPAFAQRCRANADAIDLGTLPLLHLEYPNKRSIGWTEFLAHHNIFQLKHRENIVFSSYQVSLDVAERGEGVGLGWARSVASRIADGKLVRFTDMSVHVPDGINVYRRRHVDAHPITTGIVDTVRARISPISSEDHHMAKGSNSSAFVAQTI